MNSMPSVPDLMNSAFDLACSVMWMFWNAFLNHHISGIMSQRQRLNAAR